MRLRDAVMKGDQRRRRHTGFLALLGLMSASLAIGTVRRAAAQNAETQPPCSLAALHSALYGAWVPGVGLPGPLAGASLGFTCAKGWAVAVEAVPDAAIGSSVSEVAIFHRALPGPRWLVGNSWRRRWEIDMNLVGFGLDKKAAKIGLGPGVLHLLTLRALQSRGVPSFVVRPDALREFGGPSPALSNPPGMGNCSPAELGIIGAEESANLYAAPALEDTACAAGWAIGQATYYTHTVPSSEMALAVIFKWSNTAGWVWKQTLSQSQAEGGMPGMPSGLAYDLELQQRSCPVTDRTC